MWNNYSYLCKFICNALNEFRNLHKATKNEIDISFHKKNIDGWKYLSHTYISVIEPHVEKNYILTINSRSNY